MDFAGYDQLGRRVHLAFARQFSDIQGLAFPEGAFVVLLGGPTHHLPVDLLYSTAQRLLQRGAVYVMCWGDGASRLEDIVDEAGAMSSVDQPRAATVMTTAHEGESIREVLDFATTVAIPAEPLDQSCDDAVLVFHQDVHWYNEAHNVLEDILGDGVA